MKMLKKILLWFFVINIAGMLLFIVWSRHSDHYDHFYFQANDEVDQSVLNKAQEIIIQAKDSTDLYAYWFDADSAKAIIYFMHGAGSNVSKYEEKIGKLTHHGFHVLAVEYRGYGKSTGQPTFDRVIADNQAWFDQLVNTLNEQELPVIILGQSLGGKLAIKLAADNDDKLTGLVTEGAMSSNREIAVAMNQGINKLLPYLFVGNKYPSTDEIQKVEGVNKLIIHSSQDEIAPFWMGKKIFENARKPKSFWDTQCEHVNGLTAHPEEYLHKLDGLLE